MGSWQGEGHGQLVGGRAWTVCRGKDMNSLQGEGHEQFAGGLAKEKGWCF